MSAKNKRKGSWLNNPKLLLCGLPILAVVLVVRYWSAIAGRISLDGPPDAGTKAAVDVGKEALAEYADYLGGRASISITIYSTIDEFDIRPLAADGQGHGSACFLVTPQQYQFLSTDIEERVRAGLVSEYSNANASNTPLWKSWAIETNGVDHVWKVRLSGVAGEGTIRLTIGNASAEIPVSLPKLFPIWNYVRYADRRNGIVRIDGYNLRKGDVLKPDLARDLCGYKIHSISNQTIWFEVVYAEPNPAVVRSRWPDVRIDYRVLDSGQNDSVIVFEGGDVMKPGDIAVLDEHSLRDSLKLDADSFKSNRAVLFRYRDCDDRRIADMIAVTFQ